MTLFEQQGVLAYLVVLFDDVLCSHGVVLQVSGQIQHVLGQFLLQVVVMLQDGVQLCCGLTLVQGKTSVQSGHKVLHGPKGNITRYKQFT